MNVLMGRTFRTPTWTVLSSSRGTDQLVNHKSLRVFSSNHQRKHSNKKKNQPAIGVIHKRGDVPYGTRQYLLLPPSTDDDTFALAILRAHRNIIFGAKALQPNHTATLPTLARPLLQSALDDCAAQGEQVQAISALYGLSDWVRLNMEGRRDNFGDGESSLAANLDLPPSQVLEAYLDKEASSDESALISLDAVWSIATATPRKGHSVVGQGTFRDGETLWKELATEFVQLGLSDEVQLYRQEEQGDTKVELLTIEHLADTNPAYLKAAGGAMARFVFL